MIRLTVLYNLPPGSDEEAFLRWRLGEHQEANAAMPGVQRTDFARVHEAPQPGASTAAAPPWRFMTTAEWDTRAEFERSFYGTETQTGLEENVKRIADAVFLVSEILTATDKREETS